MKKLLAVVLATIVLILTALFGGRLLQAAVPSGNYLELLGGYVRATSLDSSIPAGFTAEVWVRPDSLDGVEKILSIGNKANSQFHYEVGVNGGSLQFNYRYGSGGLKFITAGNIPDDEWVHLAVTVDASSTKLFINGVNVFTTQGETQLKTIGSNIVLGGSYLESSNNPEGFKGAVDELRISNIVRDIVGLWNSGVYNNALSSDGNTVLLWHLDEARGQLIANDSSANNLDGTLIGGDSKVHFFGILPTNTPFRLPTINWSRPILPTINFPFPTTSNPQNDGPTPTGGSSFPTSTNVRDWPRPTRPVFQY